MRKISVVTQYQQLVRTFCITFVILGSGLCAVVSSSVFAGITQQIQVNSMDWSLSHAAVVPKCIDNTGQGICGKITTNAGPWAANSGVQTLTSIQLASSICGFNPSTIALSDSFTISKNNDSCSYKISVDCQVISQTYQTMYCSLPSHEYSINSTLCNQSFTITLQNGE